MVTLHEVITFLVSMQISIAACRPIMSIDVVEVVIWRESSVSGGSGAVQMFLRDRKSGSAGMPRPISYAVFCLKKKKRKNRESVRGRCGDVHSGRWTPDSGRRQ